MFFFSQIETFVHFLPTNTLQKEDELSKEQNASKAY